MTLQATETLQNGPFQAIFNSSGNFVGFLNPRANGLDLRIGGDQPGPATFTTLTVSGTATAASFVGPLTGNASTATTLATARNINGVAFNGSADITVTAAASTLTGTTLAASVVSASLNSITPTGGTLGVTGIQTITANSASAGLTVAQSGAGPAATFTGGNVLVGTTVNSAYRLDVNGPLRAGNSTFSNVDVFGTQIITANSASAGLTLVQSGAGRALLTTGSIEAGSFVGPLTGNASTATTLATARNINGVSFNGSADITVTAAAGTLTGATLAAGVTASSLTSVGTLAALTVSGTSTLGVTRASAADGAITFGVAGTTRGVRFNTSSYGTAIEGVDNTLGASYQPLNIVASALGLYTTGGNAIALGTSSGTPQMYVTNTTSAVNYATITGGATGGNVTYGVAGSDTNISKEYRTKGAGFHVFTTNTGQVQLQITHTASAVNYPVITGAATGNAVTASAEGSDANIDFAITPKGTGVLRFGTHSALAAETVTGYITIKDAAGNSRKLAVLS